MLKLIVKNIFTTVRLKIVFKNVYSHFKATLLWFFYVFVLSCVCYVFVRVYLYVLCGHLLGKG